MAPKPKIETSPENIPARDFLRAQGKSMIPVAKAAGLAPYSDEGKAFRRSIERFVKGEHANLSEKNRLLVAVAAEKLTDRLTLRMWVELPRDTKPGAQYEPPRVITMDNCDPATAILDGYTASYDQALREEIGGTYQYVGTIEMDAALHPDWEV